MKFSRTLIAMALTAGTAFTAMAGTYTYQDKQYNIAFKGKEIVAKYCQLKDGKVDKKNCRDSKANVKELSDRLTKRIDEADALLKKKDGLIAAAKKQAKDKEAIIVKDDASGKSYVMLSLTDGFNLPLDMEKVEKDDYSLVVTALTANKQRYESALKHLSAGKLPKDKKTDRYGDVSEMLDLQNIIEFSKSI